MVVAHAGIGTILSARRHARPLVILPRKADLGEHRNEHQMATARAVAALPGVHVAWEAAEIAPFLDGAALAAAGESGGAGARGAHRAAEGVRGRVSFPRNRKCSTECVRDSRTPQLQIELTCFPFFVFEIAGIAL